MIKSDIEGELYGRGDYVQIDMIRRYLQETISNDMRRFAALKLCQIYEKRNMFFEAGFLYHRLAEIALNYAERMNHLIKEVENQIKAGFFQGAEAAANRIAADAKPMEKAKMNDAVRGFYRTQAQVYEKEARRSNSIKIYEKLLEKAVNENDNSNFLVFTYSHKKYSFTGEMSNELLYRYPDKVILIAREQGDDFKGSIRSANFALPPILSKALEGLDGQGGGHEHACGFHIKKQDFIKFKNRIEKQVK